jgi:hypothetical protein
MGWPNVDLFRAQPPQRTHVFGAKPQREYSQTNRAQSLSESIRQLLHQSLPVIDHGGEAGALRRAR